MTTTYTITRGEIMKDKCAPEVPGEHDPILMNCVGSDYYRRQHLTRYRCSVCGSEKKLANNLIGKGLVKCNGTRPGYVERESEREYKMRIANKLMTDLAKPEQPQGDKRKKGAIHPMDRWPLVETRKREEDRKARIIAKAKTPYNNDMAHKDAMRVLDQPQPDKGKHSPDCASLEGSAASKRLGKCYCDCGADETVTDWKLWEEIDSVTIFPTNVDPDDLSFGRAKPICVIPLSTPFKIAKLIANAPKTERDRDQYKAHAEALAEALEKVIKGVDAGYITLGVHDQFNYSGVVAVDESRSALAAWRDRK